MTTISISRFFPLASPSPHGCSVGVWQPYSCSGETREVIGVHDTPASQVVQNTVSLLAHMTHLRLPVNPCLVTCWTILSAELGQYLWWIDKIHHLLSLFQ